MNSIKLRARIDYYNDLVKAPRFEISSYENAVNDSITVFIDTTIGDIKGRLPYGFQHIEQIRSRLYTLIAKATPTITTIGTVTTDIGTFTENHVNFPDDYYHFIAAWPLIDGLTDYCRPMNYGQRGPILKNTFKKPSNTKTYYNEDSTGLIITRGTGGTFTSLTLEYLKKPAVFNLGRPANYTIGSGANLAIGTYIATEDNTVVGGITYMIGDEIVLAGATPFTAGQVVLKSATTTCDLPDKVHETIAKMASANMLATVGMVNSSMLVNNEVQKNN